MEDVPLEKQSEYLTALLTPLCQQVISLAKDCKLNVLWILISLIDAHMHSNGINGACMFNMEYEYLWSLASVN